MLPHRHTNRHVHTQTHRKFLHTSRSIVHWIIIFLKVDRRSSVLSRPLKINPTCPLQHAVIMSMFTLQTQNTRQLVSLRVLDSLCYATLRTYSHVHVPSLRPFGEWTAAFSFKKKYNKSPHERRRKAENITDKTQRRSVQEKKSGEPLWVLVETPTEIAFSQKVDSMMGGKKRVKKKY